MKTIAQLDAHRKSIADAFALVKPGIPEEIQRTIELRVQRHDYDKYLAILKGDAVAYAKHDFAADHHVAHWVTAGGLITTEAFIEHVLDHIAVNMDRDQKELFDLSWFYTQQAFSRDNIFVANSIAQPLIDRAKWQYSLQVNVLSEFLMWIEAKLGPHSPYGGAHV